MVSASDRDPFASDLGPSTFVSRTLSGSCADAVRVDPELGGSCGDASVLLVGREHLCGAVVASVLLAAREIFVVPEIFICGACC